MQLSILRSEHSPIIRLVLLPHGGGTPASFQSWLHDIPPGVEILSTSLSSTSHSIAQALLRRQPPLPILLFGHSCGGLKAFQVELELELQGCIARHVYISAHKSPHFAIDDPPMHELDEEHLANELESLGSDLDPETLAIVLDSVRQDFRQDYESIQSQRDKPFGRISAPLTACGGRDDHTVPMNTLQGWKLHAENQFNVMAFDGGHFYKQDALLRTINATISSIKDALPLSILRGPVEPYPDSQCLHELFTEQAVLTPDAVAVVDVNESITFKDLDELSSRLANHLGASSPDSVIGIGMERSLLYVVAYLAILKSGAAYMPLEMQYPSQLVESVLQHVRPRKVVASSAFVEHLPAAWRGSDQLVVIGTPGWIETLASAPKIVHPRPTPDNLAYVVMTSGTTGKPKGICCPHRGAVASYHWRHVHAPYSFDGDEPREACNVFFVWECLRPLLKGKPCYVIPDTTIFDVDQLVPLLDTWRITRMLMTPSLLEQVLSVITPNSLPHLRVLILCGEVVPTELVQRLESRLPHIQTLNLYSISECHDVCTAFLSPIDVKLFPKFASCGQIMSNVNVAILDEERKIVPMGMAGEVCVGGVALARGYFQDSVKTADRFIVSPHDGEILYRTGDLGRFVNGILEVQGRIDFMVKIRGWSVVPMAVESAICSHEDVETCVVLAVDDQGQEARAGVGQPVGLAAYCVLKSQPSQDAALPELKRFLRLNLPHYAIPAHFVILDALPLSPTTGKLDRSRLPVIAHRPASHSPPPLPPIESILVGVWTRLLCLEQPIDVDQDSFWDLGGHSLLLTKMCAECRAMGMDISVADVFTTSATVRSLADFFRNRQSQDMRANSVQPTAAQMRQSSIAVVGVACRFPGAPDLESFWHVLKEGRETIDQLDSDELRELGVPDRVSSLPGYVPSMARLHETQRFNPALWGLTEAEAAATDPQHRIFLQLCWQALENAGWRPRNAEEQAGRIGVYGSCWLPLYLLHTLNGGGLVHPEDPVGHLSCEIGNDKDYLATRVAWLLGLHGPAISVQASCASSLVSVSLACQSLRAGECDAALAGAASLTFPAGGYVHVEGGVSSSDGHCRPFDSRANGTVLGDGAGVIVLRRLEDALTDNQPIWGVIRGCNVNQDGHERHGGFGAPSVQGQSRAIVAALDAAGVSASQVGMIEAHGTATTLGDSIEVAALTSAFRSKGDTRVQQCALGSVKANLGHSNIAAGMAGIIKTLLCLRHQEFVGTVGFQQASGDLRLEASPFFVRSQGSEWPVGAGQSRIAGVSCFGVGGTNCHMLLEEAPVVDDPVIGTEVQLPPLCLSAASEHALGAMAKRVHDWIKDDHHWRLAARILHKGRESLEWRMVAKSNADELHTATRTQCAFRSVVFLFPGQGSRYPDGAATLFESCPLYAAHYASVQKHIPLQCTPSVKSQLSLFCCEVALLHTLVDFGVKPVAMVGHSLGEYAAAVGAGVLTVVDAIALLVARGGGPASDGAMISVHMSETQATAFLDAHFSKESLWIAVVNAPQRVVLAGTVECVDKAALLLPSSKRLAIRHPFHTPLTTIGSINAAAQSIQMNAPALPMTSCLTGGWMNDAPNAEYWGRQAMSCVRFSDCLSVANALPGQPIMLEVGPTTGLTTLASLVGPDSVAISTMREADLLMDALCDVWLAGGSVDWSSMHGQWWKDAPPRLPQMPPFPLYPFDADGHICEPLTTASVPKHSLHVPLWKPLGPLGLADSDPEAEWTVLSVGQGRAIASSLCRLVAGVDGGNISEFNLSKACVAIVASHCECGDVEALLDFARCLACSSLKRPIHAWLIIADGGSTVLPSDPAPNSWHASMASMFAVLAQELPFVTCRVIDAPMPTCLARVARILKSGRSEDYHVALRHKTRWARHFAPLECNGSKDAVRPGAVYLVTGGLGRIGRVLTDWLVEKGARVVVTTRRSSVQRGSSVFVVGQVHAESESDLIKAFRCGSEHFQSPVEGIFHAAGVAKVQWLTDSDPSTLKEELAAKNVLPLRRAVESAAPNTTFVILFSSLAAWLGGVGLSAYAAANAYMESVAAQIESSAMWLNVAWDDWLFEYGPEQTSAFEATGVAGRSIKPDEALSLLNRVLAAALSARGQDEALDTVLVAGRPLAARYDQWVQKMQPPTEPKDVSGSCAEQVIAVYSSVLGVARCDSSFSLFELGGDSLTAPQLLMRLRQTVQGAEGMPLRCLFDLSIDSVIDWIQRERLK